MAKKNRNGNGYGGHSGPPHRPAIGPIAGRAIAAKDQAVPILLQVGQEFELPDWSEARFVELHEALPEDRKNSLAGLLGGFADLGKRLKDTTETNKVLNEAVASRLKALDDREQEIIRRETAVGEKQKELAAREESLAERDRDITLKEVEARNGFAAQKSAALADLKQEIGELEARRDDLRREAGEAEVALTSRKHQVELAQRRVDTGFRELESARLQIREEARREVEHELELAKDARGRAERRAERAFELCRQKEEELDALADFRNSLGNRDPQEVIDELTELRRKVRALEAGRADFDADGLHTENLELRNVRDGLTRKLDEMGRELAEKSRQLSQLRLGVSDRENLEREKRVLEKHVQILSARLTDLSSEVDELTDRQKAAVPFPQLSFMDADPRMQAKPATREVPDLGAFAEELRHRIAGAEPGVELFYRLDDVRFLLAGLAMSPLHIFQGISGTGKTSLAKAFAKAVGGHCTDISVQAGWRDRDDLLGHYNAFEKKFYEKDCLQGLYRAQTPGYRDRINVILLDEMNLSRPEQYFAEFLSAIEKNDPGDRVITLSESALPNAPAMLMEGRKVRVPRNVWFIGTANHDETTNEFADKTYDRAHVMVLPRHEETFEVRSLQPATFSFTSLESRFEEAAARYQKDVSDLLDEVATGPLTRALGERFGIGWGNRFERQALRFIPAYVASGGEAEDALDHLLASRIMRRGKVTGRYDATSEDLTEVEAALNDTFKAWGGARPTRCLSLIDDDRRAKGRGA